MFFPTKKCLQRYQIPICPQNQSKRSLRDCPIRILSSDSLLRVWANHKRSISDASLSAVPVLLLFPRLFLLSKGSSTPPSPPAPPCRKDALNLNLISHPEHGAAPHFSSIEAVLRRHRAKKSSRSQTSKPGRRAGRRSLEIGMETGEDTDRPSGPGDSGLRFGCASFNQDSTYV